jgi:AAA domain
MTPNDVKPTTHQRDLANLPPALQPLIERDQWCIWRWTQLPNGKWQKPPFMAVQPDRHASTTDPTTWTDYPTALAAVQAGHADGISYILTKDDPFGAIDLDHCRDQLGSIAAWAQNYMQAAHATYQEITPSGEGIRIWGVADGDPLNRKFALDINGNKIAAELFRRTNKALTITGYALNSTPVLTNIDKTFDWAVTWGERQKAAAIEQRATSSNGNSFNGNGSKYGIDEIEQIVREGAPAGADRSGVFHAVIGHYVGCGWDVDRIFEHLQEHPQGIGGRYLAEDRLRQEIERSAGKYAKAELPLFEAKAPPEPEPEQPKDKPLPEDKLDDDLDEEPPPRPDPKLPRFYSHGDPDSRPLKSWLIKHLIPEVGHGLLSGQWGAGKTFTFFDLAAALNTGQPWLGHVVKRQCGVLLIAAEGADEVRLRLDAVVREKCGGMARAPFRWYETAPLLLHKGAVETLIAMARQAEASLQDEFGLPLGLIGIDTVAACAGYNRAGDEYDNAVGQAVMNVLKAVAQALKCFVLGVDHFGKDLLAGTRGASSKESSGDVVLACLGDKQVSGSVTNTRLAVRKHRGGRQGQEYPFTLRLVGAPEKDEDGDPITTMVIDWLPAGAVAQQAPLPPDDPWARPKRQDQRTAVLRLKRVLMAELAERGVDQPTTPGGPIVRMINLKAIQTNFYASTPADGTPKQKRQLRYVQFRRALDWAEDHELIGVGEIADVSYIWLARPNLKDEEPD